MQPPPLLAAAADTGVLIEFGGGDLDRQSERVLALDAALRRDPPRGVVEIVPALRSLLVIHDPLATGPAELEAALRALLDAPPAHRPPGGVVRDIPVVYGGEAGPDLEEVAAGSGMTAAGVVALHTGGVHRVAMLGHLPGLPYLTGPASALPIGRRSEPRQRVPAGSVAVAGGLTCIYPVAAPGGWRLIGRTAERLFDPSADPPAALAPGDRVRLVAVEG